MRATQSRGAITGNPPPKWNLPISITGEERSFRPYPVTIRPSIPSHSRRQCQLSSECQSLPPAKLIIVELQGWARVSLLLLKARTYPLVIHFNIDLERIKLLMESSPPACFFGSSPIAANFKLGITLAWSVSCVVLLAWIVVCFDVDLDVISSPVHFVLKLSYSEQLIN